MNIKNLLTSCRKFGQLAQFAKNNKLSPFLKGVPERERGGGILELMKNSKGLNILKALKSLFLVRVCSNIFICDHAHNSFSLYKGRILNPKLVQSTFLPWTKPQVIVQRCSHPLERAQGDHRLCRLRLSRLDSRDHLL